MRRCALVVVVVVVVVVSSRLSFGSSSTPRGGPSQQHIIFLSTSLFFVLGGWVEGRPGGRARALEYGGNTLNKIYEIFNFRLRNIY
jgi:hypothetical protein